MADIAHKWTDNEIEKLINKLEKTYSQADTEIQLKLVSYLSQFEKQDKFQQLLVSQGKLSEEDYKSWRQSKMLTGQRWADMRNVLATDYMNVNEIAMQIVNAEVPNVYAYNANYAVYQIEHDYKTATSYTLYNKKAVENLMKDDPKLLPYAKTNSPTAKLLKKRADLIWNRQKINNAVTQGILQGESVYQVAHRLQHVTNMNYTAAVRNARTMMTAAENKGRDDAYDELREQGYDIKCIWIATLDRVTRDSHRLLHGTEKGEDGYYMNGLQYPGDPDGAPEEVYNCRCCEIGELPKYGKYDIPHYSPKMGEMTYDEWLHGGSGHPIYVTAQQAETIQQVVEPVQDKDVYVLHDMDELTETEWDDLLADDIEDTLFNETVTEVSGVYDQFNGMKYGDAMKSLPKDVAMDIAKQVTNSKGSYSYNEYWQMLMDGKLTNAEIEALLNAPAAFDIPVTEWIERMRKSNPDIDGMLKLEGSEFAKFTAEERKALKTYTGSAYVDINSYLRTIGAGKEDLWVTDDVIEWAELCHNALDKAELTRDLYLRRGTDVGDLAGLFMTGDFSDNMDFLSDKTAEELNDMFQGQVGTYFGFTSTSSQWSAGFEGDVEIIFHAPQGTKASSIMGISQFGTGEGETLLRDNTRVVCEKIEESDGHYGSSIRVFLTILTDE